MILLSPGRIIRPVRQGCCGCLLALLVLAALAACALAFGVGQALTTPAEAAAPPPPARAVLLAPPVAEVARRSAAEGVFLRNRLEVVVAGGPARLASTPDGAGPLVTDDRVTLIVTRPDGSTAIWAHDFRSADRSRVVPIPPQDIGALFLPGTNEVAIVYEDLAPFTYSSSAYYLVLPGPAAPPATRTLRLAPTRGLPPSTPEGGGPVAAPPARESRSARMPPPPTPPRATATTRATESAPGGSGRAAGGRAPGAKHDPATGRLAGIALALLAGLSAALLLRRRRPTPRPAMLGWLYLFDGSTGEMLPSIDLRTYPAGLLVRTGPLRVLPARPEAGAAALIRPGAGGEPLVVGPEEAADGEAGRPLRDGDYLEIGPLTLEFRTIAAWSGHYHSHSGR